MPYLYHNFIWVEMAGIQRTSSPPLRFNGKYSSKMHEELPKTRRSAFVIKNNNASASMNMGGKEGIETQGPWEDRNAQKLIDFVGKIKDRRNSVYSLSIPELEGMVVEDPSSIEDTIERRESKRATLQISSPMEDRRRKTLKTYQQLILYLRHASSCQNEYCTVSTFQIHITLFSTPSPPPHTTHPIHVFSPIHMTM